MAITDDGLCLVSLGGSGRVSLTLIAVRVSRLHPGRSGRNIYLLNGLDNSCHLVQVDLRACL